MPDPADPGDHVPDLLSSHHLDALTPAESDAVDRHLRGCAECRSAAQQVCEVVAALGLLVEDDAAAPDPTPPGDHIE